MATIMRSPRALHLLHLENASILAFPRMLEKSSNCVCRRNILGGAFFSCGSLWSVRFSSRRPRFHGEVSHCCRQSSPRLILVVGMVVVHPPLFEFANCFKFSYLTTTGISELIKQLADLRLRLSHLFCKASYAACHIYKSLQIFPPDFFHGFHTHI